MAKPSRTTWLNLPTNAEVFTMCFPNCGQIWSRDSMMFLKCGQRAVSCFHSLSSVSVIHPSPLLAVFDGLLPSPPVSIVWLRFYFVWTYAAVTPGPGPLGFFGSGCLDFLDWKLRVWLWWNFWTFVLLRIFYLLWHSFCPICSSSPVHTFYCLLQTGLVYLWLFILIRFLDWWNYQLQIRIVNHSDQRQ